MATPKIPNAIGKRTIIFKDGDTEDIIKVIMIGEKRFEKYGSDFCKWANHHFTADEQGLEKLWRTVKYDYEYKTDKDGIQDIKTPPALHRIGKGDCKSKTLFVNAVLRCLDIPYKIRFTAYGMDNIVKHVYTIAYLGNKKIIIDTVYDYFNKEALFSFKKDYTMPEIALIEGFPEEQKNMLPTIREKAYCAPILSPEQEIYFKAKEEALKKRAEIQQKKKEVKTPEPIEYHKVTSGVASLQLIQRELEIIKVMKPEYAALCTEGINMLQKAVKGDFCVTGSVDPYLYRYAQKIKEASKLVAPADSYGLATKFINEAARGGTKASIGATYPSRQCLAPLWKYEISPFSYAPSVSQNQYGFCQGIQPLTLFAYLGLNPTASQLSYLAQGGVIDPMNTSGHPFTLQSWQQYINSIFYSYGSDTQYRVKITQFGNQMKNILNSMLGTKIHGEDNESYWFNTKADYDYVIEALNAASGVKSRWLDGTFETNPNADGTLGSGMFYSFADKIPVTAISGFVPVNDLPTQVQIKKALQDGFLNSCVNFSGVSFANVQQLARNGVLFDAGGEQPEYTLKKLWNLSHQGISGPGIGDFGISAAIIAAIAAALVAVIGAIGDAVAKSNASKAAAEDIDNNLAATSQFRPPALNQGPNENDWPLQQSNSGGGGGNNGSGGSSMMLPLAGVAVLGLMAMNEK